jgi:polyisoprenoid-binding protein YceI
MAIPAGRFRLGPDCGQLVLRLAQEGIGSVLGQDLALEVAEWSAQLDLPGDSADDARLAARLDMTSLIVPDGGGALLTGSVRREIEENARRSLQVTDHPTASFQSSQVVPLADGGTISGTLTLCGVAVPTEMRIRDVGFGRFFATALVSQAAHGITPYSAMLGAVRLRDDVQVELEIDLATAESVPVDGHGLDD